MILQPSLSYEGWDLVIKVIAAFGAMLAFVIGLWQYRKGQKWQKTQILLALIDSFEKDEQIGAACAMLDWDARQVRLEKSMKFEDKMLISALRVPAMDIATPGSHKLHFASEAPVSGGREAAFTEEETMIRDAFDAFFDFFHKLYAFQRSGLLKFSDYVYFNYWFELLQNIGEYKADPEIKKAMDNYIRKYRFIGVQELLRCYERHPEPLSILPERR